MPNVLCIFSNGFQLVHVILYFLLSSAQPLVYSSFCLPPLIYCTRIPISSSIISPYLQFHTFISGIIFANKFNEREEAVQVNKKPASQYLLAD